MTAISSGLSGYAAQSPLQRLQSTLGAQVSAGSVSSADATALGSALTSIDSALQGGSRGSGSIKDKITSLIQSQVSTGSLTGSQASELQDIFDKTAPGGQAGGPGGDQQAGGPGGAGGPPPPPRDGGTDQASSTSSGTDEISQLLAFLQQLQSATGSSSYGDTGRSSTSGTGSSLLVDTSA